MPTVFIVCYVITCMHVVLCLFCIMLFFSLVKYFSVCNVNNLYTIPKYTPITYNVSLVKKKTKKKHVISVQTCSSRVNNEIMAQLHRQHFEASQNQTRALKNIASSSAFTSTIGSIPVYDGKDKDACGEWLQCCKESSFTWATTSDQPFFSNHLKMSPRLLDPSMRIYPMSDS